MEPVEIVMRGWKTICLAIGLIASTPAFANEERALDPFHSISVRGTMVVDIAVGDHQAIRVIKDHSVVFNMGVRDGVLLLDATEADGPVRVEVTADTLNAIAIAGSNVRLEARDIQSDNFALAISGSGDALISGSCGSARLTIMGSPHIAASDLACRTVSIEISGSGRADVRASDEVRADIVGSGEVDVFGGANVVASRSTRRKVTIHSD
jgi:hypothetical protein